MAKRGRKKGPITPKSIIRSAIRRLWLRSRERAECLKLHGTDCMLCGQPHEVIHHNKMVDWERIFVVIKEEMLNTNTMPLCKQCHNGVHTVMSEGKEVPNLPPDDMILYCEMKLEELNNGRP